MPLDTLSDRPPLDPFALLHRLNEPLALCRLSGRLQLLRAAITPPAELLAWAPPVTIEGLGSPGFRRLHRARTTYVIGSMALGIGSVALVKAAARAGHLAFFGAAGLRDASVAGALAGSSAIARRRPAGSSTRRRRSAAPAVRRSSRPRSSTTAASSPTSRASRRPPSASIAMPTRSVAATSRPSTSTSSTASPTSDWRSSGRAARKRPCRSSRRRSSAIARPSARSTRGSRRSSPTSGKW